MHKLASLWTREPAVLIGALRAVLICAVGFGLSLSADQIVLVVLAFESILTVLTRASVYAPATVARLTAAGAAKVIEAAGEVVVTDAPLVVAESLNPETLSGPEVKP